MGKSNPTEARRPAIQDPKKRAASVMAALRGLGFYHPAASGEARRLDDPKVRKAILGVLGEALESVFRGTPLPFAFAEVPPEIMAAVQQGDHPDMFEKADAFFVGGWWSLDGPKFVFAAFNLRGDPPSVFSANLIASSLLTRLGAIGPEADHMPGTTDAPPETFRPDAVLRNAIPAGRA